MCEIFSVLRGRSASCLGSNVSKSQNMRNPSNAFKGKCHLPGDEIEDISVGSVKEDNNYGYRMKVIPPFKSSSLH